MHPHPEPAGHDVFHHVRAVRRWAPWILLTGIVGAAIMGGTALLEAKTYEASAEILVSQPPDLNFSFVERPLSATAERKIENEIQLLSSAAIADSVEEAGGPRLSPSASSLGDSDVIRISIRGGDPDELADELNEFLTTYVEVRREQTLAEFNAAADRIETARRELTARTVELTTPVEDLNNEIALTPDGPIRSNLIDQRDRLQANFSGELTEIQSRVSEYDDFLVQVEGATEQADGGLKVITPAAPASEPVAPSPKKDALLGLTAGLVIGLILMATIDFIDDRVRDSDDLERALPDEPLFGEIPTLAALGATPVLDGFNESEHDDVNAGVESYRSLATSLEFANIDDPVRILQVTSPVAGEGKSTTAANLAVAFAATGIRVALVDLDLRRPSLHKYFEVANDHGVTSYIVGRSSLDEALVRVPEAPELTLLPAGPATPDAAKVLHAEQTDKLIDRLRQDHDLVILDTPPILPLADALIICQITDLVVLVARVRSSGRRALRRTKRAIVNVDGPPLALVLNDTSRKGIGTDDYYGTYASSRDTRDAAAAGSTKRRNPFIGRRRDKDADDTEDEVANGDPGTDDQPADGETAATRDAAKDDPGESTAAGDGHGPDAATVEDDRSASTS